jgi:hypothetical protein
MAAETSGASAEAARAPEPSPRPGEPSERNNLIADGDVALIDATVFTQTMMPEALHRSGGFVGLAALGGFLLTTLVGISAVSPTGWTGRCIDGSAPKFRATCRGILGR